eukprot:Phypoly_transcript_03183.p1 GENE.Phypoly_transcript_03183~~Phypoly_transcript_03183.p1  ORF type:complete len:848 (+),score=76.75 Phypoly_transcript_03183:335-2545(+)
MEIAGPVPLVPKWALGLWWSKWHPYSQQELIDLVDSFQQNKIPLSALCIDMDWHLVDVQRMPCAPSGWTGYTWNTELIPSPDKLLNELHHRNVKVALNLHPAEGCYPHEKAYTEFAQFMGIDAAANSIICFNISDPKFAEGYFKFLHHPHEEIGVDMWWIDWQQEDTTRVPSLTPIWWLNHLHHKNMLHKEIRSLTFSRWGGLGSHRYPLGFSGDTIADWSNLQMLPYITSTAANVGYNWWSHDIGGFMWGSNDPDLYIRWFQFGAFSPILRLHSTKNEFEEKLPWKYDKGTFAIIKDILKLRKSMIPYIYSTAWRMYAHKDTSLVFPTYYVAPTSANAYSCPHQYFFGNELLVVPFLSKVDPEIRLSRAVVWFPLGKWFAFDSGEQFNGPQYHTIYGKIDEIPIFAPAGAVVPIKLHKLRKNTPVLLLADANMLLDCEFFEIRVFPGANHEFLMYDDDGFSMEYQKAANVTSLSQQYTESEVDGKVTINITCTIAPPTLPQQLRKRVYCVKVLGVPILPVNVKCLVGDMEVPVTVTQSHNMILLQPIYSDLTCPMVITILQEKESEEQCGERIAKQQTAKLMDMISSFNTFAPIKSSIAHSVQRQQSLDWVFTGGFDPKTSAYKAHIEVAAGCGSGCFETPEDTYVVLWNYNNLNQVFYECKSTDPALSCKKQNIPSEKIIVLSKEFKKSGNCTIEITYGQKWKDTYTIGIFVSSQPAKSPEKRKSFLQQIKKIF